MDNIIHNLKTDKEFLTLMPPLSSSDYRLLRIRLSDGIDTDPVCVWNSVIIDGCEKYEICQKQGIPFETDSIPVRNKQEAVIWICKKQLEREDLSPEIRRFLIGKRYIAELKLSRNTQMKNSSRTNVKKAILRGADKVREILGQEYSLSTDRLGRYRMYATVMERLAAIVPEIFRKIMERSIVLPVRPTIRYAKLSDLDMQKLAPQILKKPYALSRIIRGVPVAEKPCNEMCGSKSVYTASVADMPAVQKHDSDAEVMSLASTVPAWTKAIKRVIKSADITCVTESALAVLVKELSELNMIIDTVNGIIEEHKNVRN